MSFPASSQSKQRERDEFLPAITSLFIVAKWFGIPVYGGKRFLCLTILILSMLAAIEICALMKLIGAVVGYSNNTPDDRGVTARLSGSIFYGNTILSLLLSWRLIKTWKNGLSKHWLRIEIKSGFDLQPNDNIKKRVMAVAGFVALCACVEHILSMISATGLDIPPSQFIMRYILNSHRFMLQPEQYSIWVAIPIFTMSKIATIHWNFQDLIVILISMGLTSRYQRLNMFVEQFLLLEKRLGNYKNSSELLTRIHTWRKLRQAYARQANLVRKVDKQLGGLILLCNLNNFYFICLQLFLGLRKSEGLSTSRLYYVLSLGWLVLRACSVVLAAAEVNYQSRRALPSICGCLSLGCNVEVKRLKYQLINDGVHLTGMRLFLLNRKRLLEVVATVVKYELILLQYEE